MAIFFTADTHFGHKNIIRYCNRPFETAHEMNEVLIENWNKVVNQTDTVYHLGDVAILRPEKTREVLNRLNGKIYLISGNHEKSSHHTICSSRFEWIKDYHYLQLNGGIQIALFHYAMRTWLKQHWGAWHLYGHSHGNLPPLEGTFAMDIGVDSCNYTPISLKAVTDEMIKRGWKSKRKLSREQKSD
jgi:calcineurin-like phosphoesterase family protein